MHQETGDLHHSLNAAQESRNQVLIDDEDGDVRTSDIGANNDGKKIHYISLSPLVGQYFLISLQMFWLSGCLRYQICRQREASRASELSVPLEILW